MRFKVIIPVLLAGLAIAGLVCFFGTSEQAPAGAVAPQAPVVPPITRTPALVATKATNEQPIVLVEISPTEAEQDAKAEVVENRISELYDLAMTDDPASLRQILRELDNPEPRIRDAAVDAAVQFKSPDAIPALKDAEAQATDLDEKVKLQKAIDFLSLTIPAETSNSNP